MRRVGADADARRLRRGRCARPACCMKSPSNSRSQPVARRTGTSSPLDLDAVGLAELARAGCAGTRLQRRLVHRASPASAYSAPSSVWLYSSSPRLSRITMRRLAARRRTEQQQQAPADVGAGGRGLEVVDDALERLVDAEQLALEQRARAAVAHRAGCGRTSTACPTGTRGCVRASERGDGGTMSRRNSSKVPDQCLARCWRLYAPSDSTKLVASPA